MHIMAKALAQSYWTIWPVREMNLILKNAAIEDGVLITVVTMMMQESNVVSMQNLHPVIQNSISQVYSSVKTRFN